MIQPSSGAPDSGDNSLRRDIGPWGMMFAGIGAMIGSGWLFGAERAAALAGPGAILAWALGALIVFLIAAIAAELGTMFPVSGGMVRFSHATHGPLVGFMAGWASWISIASVISIEAEASTQYLSAWPAPWAQGLFDGHELTASGLALSSVLLLIYFALNYWSVKAFARSNSIITLLKLAIPTTTSLGIIGAAFYPGNVTGETAGGFLPYGAAGLLTAVSTSGIVFAFNGFQSPLNLAGEARNPSRTLPFAILGAVIASAIVYLLLQLAYLGAIGPERLAGGWAKVSFSSPFAQLALILNLQWLAMLLFFDAILSPSGAGIADLATTSRMVLGMQRNGVAPAILGRVDARSGVPRPALWFNLGVSFVFLFCFRGWGILAGAISVATVVSFMMIPIAALALRRNRPQLARPFRVPGMAVFGPLAFVAVSEMLYWARWPLTAQVIFVLGAALPIYLWYRGRVGLDQLMPELRASLWFITYLFVMAGVSWAGSAEFGGRDVIPYGWDMIVVAAIGLLFCRWGVRSGYRAPDVETLREGHDPEGEGH